MVAYSTKDRSVSEPIINLSFSSPERLRSFVEDALQTTYDELNPQRIWKTRPFSQQRSLDQYPDLTPYLPPDPRMVPCGLCGGVGIRIVRPLGSLGFGTPVPRTCCDCGGSGRQPERTSR